MSDNIGLNDIESNGKSDKMKSLFNKKSCRICLSGKSKGRLLSICNCKGTLGFVHKDCQQKWIQVKRVDKCELCSTKLNVKKVHKDFRDWILKRDNANRVYLLLDVISGLVLTPIITITLTVCIRGCLHYSDSFITSMALITIFGQFMSMLALWLIVCFDHHFTSYYKWRSTQYKYVLITNRKNRKVETSPTNVTNKADPVLLSYFRNNSLSSVVPQPTADQQIIQI